MRSKLTLRHKRPAQMAAGVIILAVPGSGIALAATAPAGAIPSTGATSSATPASSYLPIRLQSRHVGYGDQIVASGTAGAGNAGRMLALEFDPAGQPSWGTLARTTVRRNGTFSFRAPLHRSGRLRVVAGGSASPTGLPAHRATVRGVLQPAATVAAGTLAPSHVRPVTVTGELRVTPHAHGAPGRPVSVHGRLLPGIPGRRVQLIARHGRRWSAVAGTRTGSHGAFTLRFHPQAGSEQIRVKFAGDRFNSSTQAPAGTVTALHQTFVSWYSDGGSTACGFHAYYAVASLSLPCGTHVTFSNGSTTIVATVDDRGPYVGGRTYDLNQNVAQALGFGGTGYVWASI